LFLFPISLGIHLLPLVTMLLFSETIHLLA